MIKHYEFIENAVTHFIVNFFVHFSIHKYKMELDEKDGTL